VKWSASRIDVANYCRMRYWLKYILHAKEENLPAFVSGHTYHEGANGFYDKLGKEDEVLTASGRRRQGTKKYWDRDSFGRYLRGLYYAKVIADKRLREKIDSGKFHGKELEKNKQRLIAWNYKDEPHITANRIYSASKLFFDHLIEEEPPKYSEKKFDFILRDVFFPDNPKNIFDLWFSGYIDEIRIRDGQVVIRDYKSGKPWINRMKVDHDPQLTLYNAGLCSLVLKNDEMAEKLGLLERRKNYFKNNSFIDAEFEEEFFMVEAPLTSENMVKKDPDVNINSLPFPLHKTKRTNNHFFELMKMIFGTQQTMIDGNIYLERGRKCDFCNVKEACERKLEDALGDGPKEENGQGLFDFCGVTYERKLEVNQGNSPITINPGVYQININMLENKKSQKRINFKRKTSY